MNADERDLALHTADASQTAAAGAAIGRCCAAGDVIALEGELGAGKTQLVRGLAEGLGLDPRQVSSPTFVLVQEYEPADASPGTPVLVHIDAYRLGSDDDLASIGWHGHGEELREGAVVAVEWASLIEHALGEDVLWVRIAHEAGGRRVCLSARGGWRGKMRLLLQSFRDAGLSPEEGAEP